MIANKAGRRAVRSDSYLHQVSQTKARRRSKNHLKYTCFVIALPGNFRLLDKHRNQVSGTSTTLPGSVLGIVHMLRFDGQHAPKDIRPKSGKTTAHTHRNCHVKLTVPQKDYSPPRGRSRTCSRTQPIHRNLRAATSRLSPTIGHPRREASA